jgi:predicted DNA-binding transcriptional regulator YafY
MTAKAVAIDYTNYQGERRVRRVLPLSFHFEVNDWHKGEQWFMRALDLEKNENRMFAMAQIHSWTACAE